jgi:mRNA interferase MazF
MLTSLEIQMMLIERGDIYLVELDPTRGSEIQKTRPAIVITNDLANIHSRLVTVIPLSSSRLDRVSILELNIGKIKGLDKESKAMIEQIRCVDKIRLKNKLAKISLFQQTKLDEKLKLHLGLED